MRNDSTHFRREIRQVRHSHFDLPIRSSTADLVLQNLKPHPTTLLRVGST